MVRAIVSGLGLEFEFEFPLDVFPGKCYQPLCVKHVGPVRKGGNRSPLILKTFRNVL
jgi:hypothetical protein